MAFDKKAYDKEYARTHRPQLNAARKKWKEAHPEEARSLNTECQRRWREKNRERYNAYQREYRARQRALAEKEQA